MINIKEDMELNKLNHSTAHLMAQAISELYEGAKFWVGPVIENGFYYDMDLGDITLDEKDLEVIEDKMKEISKRALPIERIEVTKKEALERFKNDPYKLDLIGNIDEDLTFYKQGKFIDLCRGGHVLNTKDIKHFKLLKVSGAYFKGDSDEKMLQRVYGISFYDKKDLDDYLKFLEEVKERDHRKLGKELGLFMISEYGAGFPIWLDKGERLYRALENFWYEEHEKAGYGFIKTPTILNRTLWEKSGHWANYKENMYTVKIDETDFAIKPMNCPGSILVYNNTLHSYRDLPLRYAELGHVHRHEASGALSGLFRVRAFTQDDAHLFVKEEDFTTETVNIIKLIDKTYSKFNLSYRIELSTRPEKFLGDVKDWDKAEANLVKALKEAGKDYTVNEGDGAFYGPKLDFIVKDSLGRDWQCGTVQLDYQLPERFDITYINDHGEKERPLMLHRVIYGSLERFIGILIEHYKGAFPLWLAPVGIDIIPVNPDLHSDYARKIKENIDKIGIYNEILDTNESMGARIRESQTNKVPYTIVVGDNEMNDNTVAIRKFKESKQEIKDLDEFLKDVFKELVERL